MTGPYTGADYARDASVKADWATADYMRRCMFQALKDWNELPKAQQTAENGRKLWSESPLKNGVLQQAGTAEVVGEFYKFRTDKSRVSDEKMLACLNSLDKETIDGIHKGLENNERWAMLKAATKFSDAGKTYLGIESLSKSYRSFLQDHQHELAHITVQPKPFTEEQIKSIENDQKLFNTLDSMDDLLSHLPPWSDKKWGSPATQNLNADFNEEKEKLVARILEQAEKLHSGGPQAQAEALAELKKLDPTIDVASIHGPTQARHISDDLIRTSMKLRTTSEDIKENNETVKRAIADAFASARNVHNLAEKEFDAQLEKKNFLHQLEEHKWGRRIGDGDAHVTLDEVKKTLKDNGINYLDVDINNDGKITGNELSATFAKTPILSSPTIKGGQAKS